MNILIKMGGKAVVPVLLALMFMITTSWAAEPTLARLSFWLSPERMEEFETAYRQIVLPILERHGLKASAQRSRATVDSVFARLFEIDGPSKVPALRNALNRDTVWTAALKELGAAFVASDREGRLRHRLSLYAAPSGPGRELKVETRVSEVRGSGRWHTYSEAEGLAGYDVLSIMQDREGNLWFGTLRGVSCFDGQEWKTYTVEDGLASNCVTSVLQDRDGNFWFGTGSRWESLSGVSAGVSRYDGRTWTTFTTRDGLASNMVFSILQDEEGALWFGTGGDPGNRDHAAGFMSL